MPAKIQGFLLCILSICFHHWKTWKHWPGNGLRHFLHSFAPWFKLAIRTEISTAQRLLYGILPSAGGYENWLFLFGRQGLEPHRTIYISFTHCRFSSRKVKLGRGENRWLLPAGEVHSTRQERLEGLGAKLKHALVRVTNTGRVLLSHFLQFK